MAEWEGGGNEGIAHRRDKCEWVQWREAAENRRWKDENILYEFTHTGPEGLGFKSLFYDCLSHRIQSRIWQSQAQQNVSAEDTCGLAKCAHKQQPSAQIKPKLAFLFNTHITKNAVLFGWTACFHFQENTNECPDKMSSTSKNSFGICPREFHSVGAKILSQKYFWLYWMFLLVG